MANLDERGRPLVSPRPKPRPDFNAPRYTDPVLRGEDGRVVTIADETNPVTQLGQTMGDEFRVYEPENLNVRGVYLTPTSTDRNLEVLGGPTEASIRDYYRSVYPDRRDVNVNEVVIAGEGLNNSQTPAHEFMHRGFNLIREKFPREELEKRYGAETAGLISDPRYEHFLVQAILENEGQESFNDYQENLTEDSKETVRNLVDPLYELAREASGEAGFITDRDRGPRRRPNNSMPEEKGFFARLFGYAEGGLTKDRTFNGMSDQEYRDWISSEVERDPISRLGLDPSLLNTVQTAIPYRPDPAYNEQNAFYVNRPEGELVGIGTDLVNSKAVQAHEFRHRGFDQLREYYNEDPEYFTSRYGQVAANIIKDYSNDGNPTHEYDNEMWDNTSEVFDLPSGGSMQSSFGFEGDPEVQRRFTNFRRILGPSRDKANSSKLDQELFNGYLQLERAAGDILNAKNFSSGGLATETQMNKLMAEGGLNDDGMRVDPVSGNEVPPGSMAEEVRDDIPAQLSGGEYVVPADVVRYYGVRFFEDLRGQAKAGLTDMEADGRIGGEPAGPAGLSEEDMAMLQQVASQGGYAEGGMVGNQPLNEDALIDNIINVAKNNPALMGKLNQRGVMLYEGGMVKPEGYADGGSVGSSTFNPADWATVGGSYFGPSTSYQTPIENRTYRGPLGETVTIRFQNGVAIDPIPTGFVPEGEYVASTGSTGTSADNSSSRDRDQPFMGVSTPSAPNTSTTPDDPTMYRGVSFEDPLGAGADALEKATGGSLMNKVISTGATLLGGPALGAVVKEGLDMNQMSAARANLRLAREQGLEGADELEAKIEAELEKMGIGENLANEIFASGDSRYEGAVDQFSKFGLTTPTATPQAAISSVEGDSSGREVTTSGGVTYRTDAGSDDDNTYGVRTATGSTAPTTSSRPTARPSNLSTSSSSTTQKEARDRAKAAADKLDKPLATGGRARGGLMGKANKT